MYDLGRLHEIASILIRHGFAELVISLGLRSVLEKAGKKLHWRYALEQSRLDLPQRIRLATEELGTTFIKLAQILGNRPDLFPPEWINEFEKLQRGVPPIPFERLREQWNKDFNSPVEAIFAEFDTDPISAASIAQVHRARLRDGTQVVVKIRRPGIRPIVEADLRLMARFIKILEFEFPELAQFQPGEMLAQFKVSIRREMNMINECRNTERMAAIFQDDPSIVIPKIYWDFASERVCVQDYIEGIPSSADASILTAGLDRRKLAKVGAAAVLRMILLEGYFHADPHKGNLLYLPDNRIGFVDFGMVGHLSEKRRYQLVDLLLAISERDADAASNVLMEWSGSSYTDLDRLVADMDNLIDRHYASKLNQINLVAMLSDLFRLMRQHSLAPPPDLGLLFRALVELDGMGRQNDPEFDIVSQTVPFLRQVLKERYSPEALARQSRRNLVQVFDFLAEMPGELRQILRAVHRGSFRVNIDLTRLDYLVWQLVRATSWLTVGLVTAALIVGSSIVMMVGGGPSLLGLPAFGLIGYLFAALSSLWLLLSIWKSTRREGRNR